MTHQELQSGKSFESMLENHKPSGGVGISYAHSYLVGRIIGSFQPKMEVKDLEDGSFVITPNVIGKNEPTQVNYLQGEPTDFGTPVATVSRDEFMGAARLAYGMKKKIIGVPTWSHNGHDTSSRVQYKIYVEDVTTAGTDGVSEEEGVDGSGTATRVKETLDS